MAQAGPSRLPDLCSTQVTSRQTRTNTRARKYGSKSLFQRGAVAAMCATAGLALSSTQTATALSVRGSQSRWSSINSLSARADDAVIVGNIASSHKGPTVIKVITVKGEQDISDADAQDSSSASNLAATSAGTLPPSGRWGQSATYLPNEKLVLFAGGQVSNGTDVALTNDVFALNVSSIVSNFTAGSEEPWQKLSATGLPPHAFAAHAVVSNSDSDQVWLFGGNVNNCSDAPGWTWSPSGGLNSSWAPIDVANADTPARKARAYAMKVPTSLPGMPASSASNGTAYMMLGGKDASKDCATLSRRADSGVTADLWTFPQVAPTDASTKQAVQLQSFPVDASKDAFSLVDYSTVTVPSSNATASNQGDQGKTMFLGGLTESNELAPWDHFWVFDPWTWTWVKWSTQGEVPAGRRGHSSTLLKDGRVLVVGGMLEDGSLSNEAFLLDPSTQPATWSKVSYGQGRGGVDAPAKAYHSAVLVDDVLLMGFGASESAPAAASQTSVDSKQVSQSLQAVAAAPPATSSSSLYYLDMSNPDSWTWSDSLDGLMQGRGIVAAAAPSTSPGQSATDAANAAAAAAVAGANAAAQGAVNGANSAAQSAVNGANSAAQGAVDGANSAAQGAIDGANAATTAGVAAGQAATDAANVAAQAAQQGQGGSSGSAAPGGDSSTVASPGSAADSSSSQEASGSADSGSDSSNGQDASSADDGAASSSSNGKAASTGNNGATVGDTGAGSGEEAAQSSGSSGTKPSVIVGSLVGAAALAAAIAGLYVYKKRRDAREEGMRGYSDMEKNNSVGAPPVSMLWFNNLKRKNTISDAANKRNDENDSSFTRPAGGAFSVARNLPKRPRQSKVSTPFIEALVQDDDDDEAMYGGGPRRPIPAATRLPGRDRYLDLEQTPTTSPTGLQNGAMFLSPQAEGHLHRLSSCESIGSDGNASHFSYPYLSAMHRPSYGQAMNGTPLSGQSESAFGTNNTPQVPNESPRTKMMEQRQRQGSYSNAAMSATWSPEVAELKSAALAALTPQFGRNSLDDGDDDDADTIRDDDAETHVAVRGEDGASTVAGMASESGVSSTGATAGASSLRRHSTNSPTVYPWATPMSSQQQAHRSYPSGQYERPARQESHRAVSMPVDATPHFGGSRNSRRARKSELRVVNAAIGEESDA